MSERAPDNLGLGTTIVEIQRKISGGLRPRGAHRQLFVPPPIKIIIRRIRIRYCGNSSVVWLNPIVMGHSRFAALLGIVASSIVIASSAFAESRFEPRIMGWVENVRLFPGDMKIPAKLDTGARTSSVDVSALKSFWRNGQRWIRFRISNRNGKEHSFERPVVRVARVRRSQTKTVERPVVMLGLCIGSSYREVEVNLAVRSHLSYAMLIGRTSMKGIVIDPAQKFTMDPACDTPPGVGANR